MFFGHHQVCNPAVNRPQPMRVMNCFSLGGSSNGKKRKGKRKANARDKSSSTRHDYKMFESDLVVSYTYRVVALKLSHWGNIFMKIPFLFLVWFYFSGSKFDEISISAVSLRSMLTKVTIIWIDTIANGNPIPIWEIRIRNFDNIIFQSLLHSATIYYITSNYSIMWKSLLKLHFGVE